MGSDADVVVAVNGRGIATLTDSTGRGTIPTGAEGPRAGTWGRQGRAKACR
mgnify:CR=1 FL=1